MNQLDHPLNNFDVTDFLENYWQKKPLLIRNAFVNFQNPVTPDELAGLSCEDDIESRLVINYDDNWQLEHGPFSEKKFSMLAESNWTLLVQAVDHYIPEVAEILNAFRFIPNWRVDDIMVSYATKGGSVGPHYDHYDVFLLQGSGQRRWQLGPKYHSSSARLENPDLRLIKNFEVEQDWILDPGDMLYIPPLYGHWGTGIDNDCMTYSIGFRAPSYAELLSGFCDFTIDTLSNDLHVSDVQGDSPSTPGEITTETLDSIKNIIQNQFSDSTKIARFFGQYMTEPKYHPNSETDFPTPIPTDRQANDQTGFTEEKWLEILAEDTTIYREAASRFSFTKVNELVLSFVNGVTYENVTYQCIEFLSAKDRYSTNELQSLAVIQANRLFMNQLFDQGILYIEDELFS